MIETAAGCLDTLSSEMKSDLVNTHTTQLAGFYLDQYETDICKSLINFTDASIGGETYRYYFDDNTPFLTDPDPSYLYLSAGFHYPRQIVTSNFGCIDTAYSELYIDPFNLFAPNSFTPDGNKFINTFYPVVDLDIHEWNLQLYDRWGQLVFHTFDVERGWDGTLLD